MRKRGEQLRGFPIMAPRAAPVNIKASTASPIMRIQANASKSIRNISVPNAWYGFSANQVQRPPPRWDCTITSLATVLDCTYEAAASRVTGWRASIAGWTIATGDCLMRANENPHRDREEAIGVDGGVDGGGEPRPQRDQISTDRSPASES